MKRGLYRNLAASNLKNNRQTYIPYILTAVLTVMMYYMIYALRVSMTGMFESVLILLKLTSLIVGIFAVIILFYTNSFLMKRRKKEIGVYHILGMEKRHIMRVMGLETLFTAVVSLAGGMFFGILLGKIFFMIFLRILHQEEKIAFSIDLESILSTTALFAGIFLLIFVYNAIQVYRTNAISLLHGAAESEKEPRSKWLLAIVGIAALGVGYYIALTVQRPLEAFMKFFVAVLCVIIGTYALFTAVSIVVLKALRKNKKYYYQPQHFTTVSGMLFRMKQNAAGLANICILSTMVLILVSMSVSMYAGMENIIKNRFAWEASVKVETESEDTMQQLIQLSDQAAQESGVGIRDRILYHQGEAYVYREGTRILIGKFSDDMESMFSIHMIPLVDYCEMEGREVSLGKDEILLYCSDGTYGESELSLNDKTYHVAQELQTMKTEEKNPAKASANWYLIMQDQEEIKNTLLEAAWDAAYGEEELENMRYIGVEMNVDFEGSSGQKSQAEQILQTGADKMEKARFEGAETSKFSFYQLYGSLFFIGIYLGVIFLMATVLIIYYKQISEGYDDRERYQIMQKVGMSRQEVRRSIRSQVLTVFYLPLLTAFVHTAVAFPIVCKLLAFLNLTNTGLFLGCTVAAAAVFALFYMLIYSFTAREYYRIVHR